MYIMMVLRCAQYGPDQRFTDIQLYVFLFATHNTSRDRPITALSKRSFRQQKTNTIMEISQTLNARAGVYHYYVFCRGAQQQILYFHCVDYCARVPTHHVHWAAKSYTATIHHTLYYVVTETDHNPCYIIICSARVLRVRVLYVMRRSYITGTHCSCTRPFIGRTVQYNNMLY